METKEIIKLNKELIFDKYFDKIYGYGESYSDERLLNEVKQLIEVQNELLFVLATGLSNTEGHYENSIAKINKEIRKGLLQSKEIIEETLETA